MGKEPTTARGFLLAAARLIEKQGWCQNSYQDASGRVCLVGAMHRVGPRDPLLGKAFSRIYAAIGTNLTGWNDTKGRTERQVLTMLRKAAAPSKRRASTR